MKITIITLFKEMFKGPFDHSILKRAQEANLVQINFVNLRDFGIGTHKSVDDTIYGGGTGMVLRVDVVANAIEHAKSLHKDALSKVVLLDARGVPFTQEKAWEYSKTEHLILLPGHYEGIDDRIRTNFVDECISIGDFIVTGGEIPAMLVVDATIRLIPEVIKEEAPQFESFSKQIDNKTRLLEYPQYTKPQEYQGLKVPDVLLSGNHKNIENFRKEQATMLTKKLRPDLLKDTTE